MLFCFALELLKLRGPVAQLGERHNGIVEVMGSIPFRSTIFFYLDISESGGTGSPGFHFEIQQEARTAPNGTHLRDKRKDLLKSM
jgi:hypothetical protein